MKNLFLDLQVFYRWVVKFCTKQTKNTKKMVKQHWWAFISLTPFFLICFIILSQQFILLCQQSISCCYAVSHGPRLSFRAIINFRTLVIPCGCEKSSHDHVTNFRLATRQGFCGRPVLLPGQGSVHNRRSVCCKMQMWCLCALYVCIRLCIVIKCICKWIALFCLGNSLIMAVWKKGGVETILIIMYCCGNTDYQSLGLRVDLLDTNFQFNSISHLVNYYFRPRNVIQFRRFVLFVFR